MNKTNRFSKLFLIVVFLLAATTCQTTESVPQRPVATEVETPEENPEEVIPEEEVPEKPKEKTIVTEDYEVTEEVYVRTFEEIEELINNLNSIIRDRDFQGWKEKLSTDYISFVSSEENFRNISQMPTLKKYNITIDSLEDYFTYVVGPSRSNDRVDEIIFQDDDHIKAITLVKGQRLILYYLVKIDDQWKIGRPNNS